MAQAKPAKSLSIIHYIYEPNPVGHECVYCKSENSVHSQGILVHSISPENYEQLVYQGWCREWNYLYKATGETDCCPKYQIRLRANHVKISKSQRKVLRRFKNYLENGTTCKGDNGSGNGENVSHRPKLKSEDITAEELRQSKDLRGPQELHKYFKGLSDNEHKLPFTTKLFQVGSRSAEKKYFEMEHGLYKKYMMTIHGDSEEFCSAERFKRFLWDDLFYSCEVADGMLDDTEFYESQTEAVGSSPLPILRPGTYHEHYYISSTLFAVGVMEILPTCIYSVSFFYDPEYLFLNPGTFSALREINFANELAKDNPQMEYYVLGCYVHNCGKIKYKSRFKPCQLLCPVTNEWIDFDWRVSSLLESSKMGSVKLKEEVGRPEEIKILNERNGDDDGDSDEVLLEKVLILYKGRIRKVKEFLSNNSIDGIYADQECIDVPEDGPIRLDQNQLQEYYLNMFKSYVNSVGPGITSTIWIYVNGFEML